jgi:hypothetical protein
MLVFLIFAFAFSFSWMAVTFAVFRHVDLLVPPWLHEIHGLATIALVVAVIRPSFGVTRRYDQIDRGW